MVMNLYCPTNYRLKHGASEVFVIEFIHLSSVLLREFTLRNFLHLGWLDLVSVDFVVASGYKNSSTFNYQPNSSSCTAVEKYLQELVKLLSKQITGVPDIDDEEGGNEEGDEKLDGRKLAWSSIVVLASITKHVAHLSVSLFQNPSIYDMWRDME